MQVRDKLRQLESGLHVFLLILLYAFLRLTYPATFPEDDAIRLYWTITFDFAVFAGCAYAASYYLLSRFFVKGKYALFFVWYTGLVLTGTTLILLNDMVMAELHPSPGEEAAVADAILFFGSTMGMVVMISSVGIGIRALTYWIRSTRQLHAMRQEKMQTELAFLKSQMNPHFLFNTINLIFGHIDKTNKTARDITVQFSELLRYQLYECDVAFIDIEKEINYLHNYIGLQRLRKNSSLDCTVQVSGELSGFDITPLLMIPFVENAFKFVSYDEHQKNYIHITISRLDRQFRFTCANTKARIVAKDVVKTGGLGLQNVRRRLQLIYPEKHTLVIRDLEDTHEVELSISLT